MNNNTDVNYLYHMNIEKAIKSIKEKDYPMAEYFIGLAMMENHDQPEVNNLFGAIAELKGDNTLAIKHYRAAYALDPTYAPAAKNLERITSYSIEKKVIFPDLGNVEEHSQHLKHTR